MYTALITTQYRLLAACQNEHTFLGIRGWYKFIPRETVNGSCTLRFQNAVSGSGVSGKDIAAVWLVLAGLLDALVRVAAMVAVAFFIIGAFKLVTSQGSPEGVKNGKNTMTNALIGLVIAIIATWAISWFMYTIVGVQI